VSQNQSQVYAWDGCILYVTREHLNNAHAHFPALLQIGLGTPFAITLGQHVRSYHDIVVMAPNVNHSTDSENQPYLALLIDPDHALYRYLHPLLNGESFRSLPASSLASFHPQFQQLIAGQFSFDQAKQLVLDILSCLNPNTLPSLPWDIRVLQSCRYIQQCVPQQHPTVAEVAAHVGLSESRLMHLFSQQLGISMRRYILWLRIRYAIKLWAAGKSLIEIALGAGFSDQAHYTRTLRSMVDFAPSMLKAKTILVSDAISNEGKTNLSKHFITP
jgi:AraC family transcriptional regulator of arabinose operon